MNEPFEKILVTGGTGFTGRKLVAELMADDYAVTVLTRNGKARETPENWKNKIELIEIDLLNHAAIRNLVMKLRPSVVINLAGTTGRSDRSGEKCHELNFAATENLLNISQRARTRRIILIGTADEYGNQAIPQNESLPLKPQSSYAISKAEMTKTALAMYEKSKTPVTVLRPFTVYGAGQPAEMFMAQALNCAMRNTAFEMTKGTQRRDYIYIEDYLKAVKAAMTMPGVEGEVINVGSGAGVELKSVAEKIWEMTGANKSLLKIGARTAGASEVCDTCADISKAARMLDWRPETSLENGIKLTIAGMNAVE